jgi:peptide/nickel transport system ATP-binding protein
VDTNSYLLEVIDLKKYFPITKGLLQRTVGHVKAVDGVSLRIRKGETLGLVGESGCGKTTTGKTIIRAIDPTDGQVLFQAGEAMVDLAQADETQLRTLWRDIQMIFQDPYSSLNPRMTVLDIVGEGLVVNKLATGKELEERVVELLKDVGLNPEHLRRYPHAFSGGQRQRIGIARALALNPQLIIADEPVSALDVSVQAQILNLLKELQARFQLTYLFISHDLGVVQHISDHVAVMYTGRIVESGSAENVFENPGHPYTEALLQASPQADPRSRGQRVILSGDVADLEYQVEGCSFYPRCRYAQKVCSQEAPKLTENEPGHLVTCHLASQLELQGIG